METNPVDLENNCRATFRVTGRTSDLGSKLQWILKQTPVQNRFVSQFGLRIWVVSQFGLRILDQNSIVHLETNSCATLFRVTVRTSCLTQKSSAKLFRITVWTSELVFFTHVTSDIGSKLRWILEKNSSAQCFRVTVRTSDLKTTPVQNHFVSQLGLRIWIKTPVDLGNSFSAKSFRVTVRTSGLGKKLQFKFGSCHTSDFGSCQKPGSDQDRGFITKV